MPFPNEHELTALRERYPAGTRIRLNHMDEPYSLIPPVTTGSVDSIDAAATVHMQWDNGRTLSLIPGEDDFTIITNEEEKS